MATAPKERLFGLLRRLGNAGLPDEDGDRLTLKKIGTAFASLPRVLGLVYRIQPFFTVALGVLYILQGFLPALTAFISAQLIQSVVTAITKHGGDGTGTLVIWFVVAQFGAQALSSLLSTASNIFQQLLQEKTSYAIQLQVMEKANTLDLAFFEDAKFYDALQQAQREATQRPVGMISTTFGLGRTLITFISMIAILTHLAWWIALLALLSPVPAFIANVNYGWWGYQMMRRQSPLRREMAYYNQLLTTDTYNKEVKLFTLGGFFLRLYRERAQQFYEQAKSLDRAALPRLLWLGRAEPACRWRRLPLHRLTGRAGAHQLRRPHLLHAGRALPRQQLRGPARWHLLHLREQPLHQHALRLPRLSAVPSSAPERASSPKAPASPSSFVTSRFRYPGSAGREHKGQALRDVSFTIHEGEAVALVGRNGAGKTTIVKLLTRLYDPDEGQILINGHDISEYDLEALRQKIGVIFQDYVTYYLTAGHNIGVGRSRR